MASARKGKGKGSMPPPTPPKQNRATPKMRAMPTKPNVGNVCGMAALLNKVEVAGQELDKTHGLEIENVDLSGIDPTAKGETFKCPRCQQEILVSMKDTHKNSHSAEILPWLFLGASRNADNSKELTIRTHITHILNVAHEVNLDHDTKKDWQLYNKEKGVPCEYKKISWTDTADQDIIKEMWQGIEFIHAAHEENPSHHVLVHCIQGISRSVSVILYYLMQYEKKSLREAFEHVKTCRSVVEPRQEFVNQLGKFECALFKIDSPTLTSDDLYDGKVVLNLDDPRPDSVASTLAAPKLTGVSPTASSNSNGPEGWIPRRSAKLSLPTSINEADT